jgi:hypothetical protein
VKVAGEIVTPAGKPEKLTLIAPVKPLIAVLDIVAF